MLLSQLKLNYQATIININCQEALKNRLKYIGVEIGTSIKLVRTAPFNDPLEFCCNGIYFAIRKSDCDKIEVK